jgi:hypothetical protein
VLFVLTPTNSTVIRFTQLGMLVNSTEVPDTETAVSNLLTALVAVAA